MECQAQPLPCLGGGIATAKLCECLPVGQRHATDPDSHVNQPFQAASSKSLCREVAHTSPLACKVEGALAEEPQLCSEELLMQASLGHSIGASRNALGVTVVRHAGDEIIYYDDLALFSVPQKTLCAAVCAQRKDCTRT